MKCFWVSLPGIYVSVIVDPVEMHEDLRDSADFLPVFIDREKVVVAETHGQYDKVL